MRRREFITLIVGIVTACPAVLRAQQHAEQIWRIGYPSYSTETACIGGCGDRVRRILRSILMSATGTKRTSERCFAMSAFGGKADIRSSSLDVCF